MADRPQCVACDARDTLELIKPEWYVCSCCAARLYIVAGVVQQIIYARATSAR